MRGRTGGLRGEVPSGGLGSVALGPHPGGLACIRQELPQPWADGGMALSGSSVDERVSECGKGWKAPCGVSRSRQAHRDAWGPGDQPWGWRAAESQRCVPGAWEGSAEQAGDTRGCVLRGCRPRGLSRVAVLASLSWEGGQRAAGR